MQFPRKIGGILAVTILLVSTVLWLIWPPAPGAWTESEIELLRSLWIGSLPPVPADPSNAVADDPRAARFGQRLFFDTRLSANGEVACATCHQPEHLFTDGLDVAQGVARGERHTMGLAGVAYSPWMFWDGRRDSLWAQALAPLESPVEHGGNRLQFVELLVSDAQYRSEYAALFDELPELPAQDPAITEVFVNMGKAIAAYERLLVPGASRFDRYVQALLADDERQFEAMLSDDELAGLRLFIGDAQCINCHNGPLFTNNEFHNTAVLPARGKLPSMGRVAAVRETRADPFNCVGRFSDDPDANCAELRFARTGDDLIGAHKTPSLRNVALTAPYMHAGQMTSLTEIIDQYNRAPLAMVGHSEAKPLNLWRNERKQLEAFLRTLSGPLATSPEWLAAP
ncbi:MAG: cytochrome-c peroxidase [Gammaproteobacteria bacterium]|nr:MAG: cytochrome-c peroxidase [Gammaproteobacteria bacterium]